MTTPEPPPYRPRLVETEVFEPAAHTASEIWDRQAVQHNHDQHVRRIREQVAAARQAEHDAYIAECYRTAERIEAENALTAARWPSPTPYRRPDPAPDPSGETVRSVPDLIEPVEETTPLAATLDARAAALFRRVPDVSRDDVQAILGCNTYRAKQLHANQSRGAR